VYNDKPMESQGEHGDLGWIRHPDKNHWVGFSDSSYSSGEVYGHYEPTEDEIAEKIFNWWVSGKSYSQWYADTYLQQKINFKDNDQ